MDAFALFTEFLASPEGQAIKLLLVGTVLTFGLGVLAALRDGSFSLGYLDSFVRSTIWGRIAPVMLFLFLGYVSGEQLISGPAIIAAGAVAVGLIKAAADSIGQIASSPDESRARNTPPTD